MEYFKELNEQENDEEFKQYEARKAYTVGQRVGIYTLLYITERVFGIIAVAIFVKELISLVKGVGTLGLLMYGLSPTLIILGILILVCDVGGYICLITLNSQDSGFGSAGGFGIVGLILYGVHNYVLTDGFLGLLCAIAFIVVEVLYIKKLTDALGGMLSTINTDLSYGWGNYYTIYCILLVVGTVLGVILAIMDLFTVFAVLLLIAVVILDIWKILLLVRSSGTLRRFGLENMRE